MPLRRTNARRRASRTKKYGSRRAYKARRKYGRAMIRAPEGLPRQQFIKFKYAELGGLVTGGAVNFAIHAIGMNTLQDPQQATQWLSVAGHDFNGQPMYRDQWAAMYYNYRVYASKITVTLMPFGWDLTNTGQPSLVGLAVYPSDSVCTDTDILITRQRNKCKYVDSGGSAFTTSKLTVKHYSKVAPLLGMTKTEYNVSKDTDGLLNSATNPTTMAYWNVVVQDLSTAAYINAYMSVQVKYYAKVYNPIENIASS